MRSHLLLTLAIVFGIPLASRPGLVAPADRPNVLWLVAEDFGPHLGCYGTQQVWTPNLDKLATEGVRYTRSVHHRPGLARSAARRS